MKAIETRYKGHRYRSRTEARWAVLFDHLGVKYEYEPEGYELGGGLRYLPDFYLPVEDAFVEVKGGEPTRTELHKAGLLSFHTQRPVVFAIGQPGQDDRAKAISHNFPADEAITSWIAECEDPGVQARVCERLRRDGMAVPSFGFKYEVDKPQHNEHRYEIIDAPYQQLGYDANRKRLALWIGRSEPTVVTYEDDEYGIEHLHWVGKAEFERRAIGIDHEHVYVDKPNRSSAMKTAVNAARSARFEFGESGAG